MHYLLKPSLLFVLTTCVGTACISGPKVREDGAVIQANIRKARQNNAYECAPADLAKAEAYVDFGMQELDRGHYGEAREHMDLAETYSKAAMRKADECKPAVVITPSDSDGDGIVDLSDRCPKIPEDKNGIEDDDGCPDAPQDSDKDGLMDNIDKCPADPEDFDNFQDDDGCPDLNEDRDGDTILDNVDRCPDDPEDLDGFEDVDGCPDLDNDKDNIPDLSDKCPMDPETLNGNDDDDGCPDKAYQLVSVNREKKKIEIKQTVQFQTGKFKILSDSFTMLNEIAQVLKDNPTMEILVEGHTDDVGNDSSNMRLSDSRANSVMDYLTGQGVEAKRLQAVGFGETRPIESNKTAKGRTANRRVEFKIVKE